MNYRLFITLSLTLLALSLSAQKTHWIAPSRINKDLQSSFEYIEEAFDLEVLLDNIDLKKLTLPEITDSISLRDFMKQIADHNDCSALFIPPNYWIISTISAQSVTLDSSFFPVYRAMESQQKEPTSDPFVDTQVDFTTNIRVLGTQTPQRKKSPQTVKGSIFSETDESPIIGATIYIKELKTGTYTDEEGRFELTLKPGIYTIVLQSLTFREKEFQLDLYDSGELNFRMTSQEEVLDNVVITSKRSDALRNTKMGVDQLKASAIKEIPLVMGENDILKVFSLLPGVQTVGEGSAGFNVRGSPADQNLFYIENIPLYSTSHLFGFFSAFNSDAVDEFTLYKSHMPAKYGGRLASIFDIQTKSGDKEKFKFNGGISPVSARLVVEGPIAKEKLSFLASARSTYSNYILRQISNPDFNNSKVFFGDGSLKLDYKLNDDNSIKTFLYYSLDDIQFSSTADFKNQNQGASLSWNRKFTNRHRFDLNVVHSEFQLDVDNRQSIFNDYKQVSGIAHSEVRYEGHWLAGDRHNILYGFDSKYYNVHEGFIRPISETSQIIAVDFGYEQGWETGLFIGNEMVMTDRLDIDAGIRFNYYQFLGPNAVLSYHDDKEVRDENVTDTLRFNALENIKDYSGFDYRLAMKYAVGPNFTLKGSFNTMNQYIFLLSNTIALSPNDRWKLTDNNIKPMRSQQISLGAYTKLFNKRIDFSIETYYKQVQRLVEFKDGANLLVNEFPEQDILPGDLDAYGFEFTLKKSKGKLNGWLNYVYSSSTILVDNPFNGGQINQGNRYNANFDKPHSVNLVMNYKVRKRVSLSSNVVYSTGRPITYPTLVYEQSNIPIINFTSRNANRVPDYFRVDLSVNLEGNLRSKKLLHGSWAFSVYNLTGRRNAYNIFFQNVGNDILGYRVSIFAQPIFSVSYNFKFGNFES